MMAAPIPQARPAPQRGPSQQARPAQQPVANVPAPPFDIAKINWKLYGQAWKDFFGDFFPKKVPYFFQNIQTLAPKIPDWFKKLVQDEQIAYGVVIFGFVLVFVGLLLTILL